MKIILTISICILLSANLYANNSLHKNQKEKLNSHPQHAGPTDSQGCHVDDYGTYHCH